MAEVRETEQFTLKILVESFQIRNRLRGIISQPTKTAMVLERWITFTVYGVYQTAQGIHIRGSYELLIQSIFRSLLDVSKTAQQF